MRRFFPNLSNQKYSQLGLEIAAAKRSLYFWWWRYLRLSDDYWWLCQQKGRTIDKQFAETYKLFGEVFECDFGEWWADRGSAVFSYEVDPPRVELITVREMGYVPPINWIQPVMVPLHLTKSEILSQLSELLKDHVPKALPKSIATGHEVEDLRGVRKQVLIDAHRVWCLNDLVTRGKAADILDRPERLTQYWIGKSLGIDPDPEKAKVIRRIQPEKYEHLAMRVKVNRYLAKARNIIANVELGHFPVMKEVPERERWSKKQLTSKNEAIQAVQWKSPEVDTKEFQSLLPMKKKSRLPSNDL
jgi:hypothetical protein